MLLGKYKHENGVVKGVVCTRPCSALLVGFVITSSDLAGASFPQLLKSAPTIRVDLQDNKGGANQSLIPSVSLLRLAEIYTHGEGAIYGDNSPGGNQYIVYFPVRLALSGNLDLSSDRYLDISFTGVTGTAPILVFALESPSFSSVVCNYRKMSVSGGISRELFHVNGFDVLALPTSGVDEVQLTYPTGHVVRLTSDELMFNSMMSNDTLLHVSDSSKKKILASVHGGVYSHILPLNGASQVEIIRDADSSAAFEFLALDYVELPVSSGLQSKLVPNSLGSTVNLDGSLSLKGGELDSLLRNMSSATIYLKR